MISTLERVLFLRMVSLFSAIPGEELARIAQIATEIDLAPGSLLIEEGDVGDAMFLVIEGTLIVEKKSRAIASLGPRECVGELAILDAQTRSATVRSQGHARLLRIHREAFFELMSEHKTVVQGVIKVLAQRLRDANLALSWRLMPYSAPWTSPF